MNFCKKCVQPDTRPDIWFNEEGICGACVYEDEKKKIDWEARKKRLKEIAKWARNKAKENNSNYDCVIGVSGGKDSTFQSIYSRDSLKLRPLLVNCEPENITEIGRKNIENLKNLGFDLISLRPNPKIMKKLIKKDFYEFLNPVKVTEFPLWSSAFIIADKFNIPLIVQGENPALTLGVKSLDCTEDALNIFKSDTLNTGWDRYIGDGITLEDLFMFHCDLDSLRKKETKAIFLQYYLKEWSQSRNAQFSIKYGLQVRPEYFNPYEIGTYANYYQLDGNLTQVNQLLKYIKFGFGQCTDHACYDIRDGILSRKEAIELVKKYDGKCGAYYIKIFCDFIEITVDDFWKTVEKFRGNMWKKKKGQWIKDDIV